MLEDAVAVFVRAVGTVTVATIPNVAPSPFARRPTVHVPPEYVPIDGLDDTSVSPAGSASATTTDCAASGPLLVTVTVNATLAPTAGVASSTAFVTTRFASGTLTVADAVLSAGVGSYVELVAPAVFVTAVCTLTVATTVSVAEAPFVRLPTVQVPPA